MSDTEAPKTAIKASDCISSLTIPERVALARKAGEQLAPSTQDSAKYAAAHRIAGALACDLSQQVRETLAFELRKYRKLPKSIAVRIACDIDEIAVPFLRVTPALSDSLMAELVPLLSDNAHIALAVRSDLGVKASRQLIRHANDNAAIKVVANPCVDIDGTMASLVLDHFGDDDRVMDAVAMRPNLPLSVVTGILHRVSDKFRQDLIDRYGVDEPAARQVTVNSLHEAVWRQIRRATPGQVHAHVVDLRQSHKLTPDLMLAMADRGCTAFLESALALEAGRTLTDVRETLHLANPKLFNALMQDCGLGQDQADRVRVLARRHYASRCTRREVGNPALWQQSPARNMAPKSAA